MHYLLSLLHTAAALLVCNAIILLYVTVLVAGPEKNNDRVARGPLLNINAQSMSAQCTISYNNNNICVI